MGNMYIHIHHFFHIQLNHFSCCQGVYNINDIRRRIHRGSTHLIISFHKPAMCFGLVIISNVLMILLPPKQKLSQVLISINSLHLVNLVMLLPIQFKNHYKVVTFKPIIIQLISMKFSQKKASVHLHICKLLLIALFSSEKEALSAMQFVFLTTQMLIITCALYIISFWVT